MIIVSWTLLYVFSPLTVLQYGKIDTKEEVSKVYITIQKQLIWIMFIFIEAINFNVEWLKEKLLHTSI